MQYCTDTRLLGLVISRAMMTMLLTPHALELCRKASTEMDSVKLAEYIAELIEVLHLKDLKDLKDPRAPRAVL